MNLLKKFLEHDRIDLIGNPADIFNPDHWVGDLDYGFDEKTRVLNMFYCLNHGCDTYEAFKNVILEEIAEQIYVFEVVSEYDFLVVDI